MEERDVSEFNSAVSYLNRLNLLFSTCVESAISLDIYTWFHTLLALFRELSTEMKPNEITKFESTIDTLNTEIARWMAILQRKGREPVPHDLYKKLHDFEKDLRTIMKQAGLQQKIMDDAMKALK